MRLQARRHAQLEGSFLEVTVPSLLAAGVGAEPAGRPGTPAEPGGWARVFGRPAPLYLEIGLGKDPHIIARAAAHPAGAYVGLEYSRKKLDKVHSKALRRGVENLRVLRADACQVLDPLFEDDSLAGAFVLFPDPWPKKRHRKKRLIQTPFVARLAAKLAPGAVLELRTDDGDYHEQMLEVLEAEPRLENRLGPRVVAHEPPAGEAHIPTIFETKFRAAGRAIHYLEYTRVGAPTE